MISCAIGGDGAVLENQLTNEGTADAHFLLILAYGEALVRALHDECGDFIRSAATPTVSSIFCKAAPSVVPDASKYNR